eukprot:gb/GECG01005111.1/.p1 GENE.gb/GECG01005111.1/~~gb/GECG01005111.1/.p1  ORF type:complete len:197 (+),score=24.08 gb/GECG01005111.1/:1-591(+)
MFQMQMGNGEKRRRLARQDPCEEPPGADGGGSFHGLVSSTGRKQASDMQTLQDSAHRIKRHIDKFLEGREEMDSSQVTDTVMGAISTYVELLLDPSQVRKDLQHLSHADREKKMAAVRAHISRLRRQQRENWLHVLNPVLVESTKRTLLCLNGGSPSGRKRTCPDTKLSLQVGASNKSLTVCSSSFKLTQPSFSTH